MGARGSKESSFKPRPLKQRTSSVDPRRDFSTQTWTSVLGLVKAREYLVAVDNFSVWRRHLAWGIGSGEDLREHMTKRYASSMVFMSLLLSTELAVLFNSAGVTTQVRKALANQEQHTISFWIGILIILSAVLTILSLISTFTAWSMVSAIHKENARCVLRSSIGQYAAELPGRFIVSSIYAFLLWVILFFFILLPVGAYSVVLLLFAIGLFIHTITAFSCFGRIIMHSGAMGSRRIFDPEYEVSLHPHLLHQNLLTKARAVLDSDISIRRQYQDHIVTDPIRQSYSQEDLIMRFSERTSSSFTDILSPIHPKNDYRSMGFESGSISPLSRNEVLLVDSHQSTVPNEKPPGPNGAPPRGRGRTNSLVKFSDGFDTSGKRIEDSSEHKTTTTSSEGDQHGPSNLASSPVQKKASSIRTKRPSPVKHNVSFGEAIGIRATEKPSRDSSRRSTNTRETDGGQVPRGPPPSHGIPQHRHAQPPQPSPPLHVPTKLHAPYQQPHAYNGSYPQPPSTGAMTTSLDHRNSAHERWLASGPATQNFGAFPSQQQHHDDNYQVSNVPSSHADLNRFYQPQSFAPEPFRPELMNTGAPTAVMADSRAVSLGSIPSQIDQQTDSVDSDLESFAHFHGDQHDGEDNVASYNDEDIEELLDSPPPSNNRLGSNHSIHSFSTKNTDGGTTYLAGLDISAGPGDTTLESNQDSSETGPLLARSEQNLVYNSCQGKTTSTT